jgi:hypothetical protein
MQSDVLKTDVFGAIATNSKNEGTGVINDIPIRTSCLLTGMVRKRKIMSSGRTDEIRGDPPLTVASTNQENKHEVLYRTKNPAVGCAADIAIADHQERLGTNDVRAVLTA